MSDTGLNNLLVSQGITTASEAQTPNTKNVRTVEEAERAAKQFESMFLGQLMAAMWDGVDQSKSLFGGGVGERAYSSLLHEEYAKVFAQSGGIGLADNLKSEILALQGLKNLDQS